MSQLTQLLPRQLHAMALTCLFGAVACQTTPIAETSFSDTPGERQENCAVPRGQWTSVKLVAPYNYGPELFSITPYYRGGEFGGYRIYPGKNAWQFDANDLEPGDLLTMVDGNPVTICQSALSDKLESLRSGKTIGITINRGRDFTEMDFVLTLRQ